MERVRAGLVEQLNSVMDSISSTKGIEACLLVLFSNIDQWGEIKGLRSNLRK
jgi:hypothetical protein